MENKTLQWTALEYKHEKRSVDWFWAVGIIAIALSVTSVIYGNILFAIFIIIGTFTLLMYAARAPRNTRFELTRKGVIVNDILYPYHTLESFWVHDYDDEGVLIIKSEKILMPYIVIPLPDNIDNEMVQEFLFEYLEEEEHPESLSEKVMEYLGF